MRIVVCVKHVPDLQAERGFTADGRVDRSQGGGTLSELDEHAVEAALVLTETLGVEVTVVTVGPADAEDAVRRGLQLGAQHAAHVIDEAIAGLAALDGLMSVLPSLLAAHLDLPQATLAAELTVADGVVRVRRDLDHVTEVLEAPLPAVVSVTDQANEPRYPNFKGIMAARKTPVTAWSLADLGIDPAAVGDAGARTRVLEATPRPVREDRVLITDDGEAGLRLVAYLAENRLLG